MKKIHIHTITSGEDDAKANIEHIKRKLGFVPDFVTYSVIALSDDQKIGEGRVIGFTESMCQYVTNVGEYDDIDIEIFQHCITILNNDPTIDAIVANEKHIIEGKIVTPVRTFLPNDGDQYNMSTSRYVHGLVVFRRTSLEPYLEEMKNWDNLCDFTLIGKMVVAGCKIIHTNKLGYFWDISKTKTTSPQFMHDETTLDIIEIYRTMLCDEKI